MGIPPVASSDRSRRGAAILYGQIRGELHCKRARAITYPVTVTDILVIFYCQKWFHRGFFFVL
jgi:hypothetical protein